MSLDVYLTIKSTPNTAPERRLPLNRIFIREGGQNKEISLAEWDERFPGQEPVWVTEYPPEPGEDIEVYTANITHNLGRMAQEAGLHDTLWCPEKLEITKAYQLIDGLRQGLRTLEKYPEEFKKLNPSNGWGTYEGLVEFVRNYLEACEKYPEAEVKVWR